MPNEKKTKDPVRVKAGKKSKKKGDSLERWVANQLQTRYSDPNAEFKDREFQRTPLSGGMKSSYPGDILVPDWFPFMIEAKARRNLDLACAFPKIIDQGVANPILKIWESEIQKVLPGRTLLLVIKHWGCDPVVVMSTSIFDRLVLTDIVLIWTRVRLAIPTVDLTAIAFSNLLRLSKESLVRIRSILDDKFVVSERDSADLPSTSMSKSQATVEGRQAHAAEAPEQSP